MWGKLDSQTQCGYDKWNWIYFWLPLLYAAVILTYYNLRVRDCNEILLKKSNYSISYYFYSYRQYSWIIVVKRFQQFWRLIEIRKWKCKQVSTNEFTIVCHFQCFVCVDQLSIQIGHSCARLLCISSYIYIKQLYTIRILTFALFPCWLFLDFLIASESVSKRRACGPTLFISN